MGSTEEQCITVLVTGFEAFQDKYPINPSFEIARSLPKLLRSPDGRAPTIRIILHEPAVKVNYEHVSELIPGLLAAYQDQIDMVLHIGMASGRKFYTIEKYARRDGYTKHRDLDDKLLDENYGSEHFPDCPVKMATLFDYQKLWEDWWHHVPAAEDQELPLTRDELCQSEDAGSFLCDFIYYNSLAFYARRKSVSTDRAIERPVLFYHVPGESDDKTLMRGTVAATALIKAMADQIARQ